MEKGLRCPRCNTLMTRIIVSKDPFEAKYHCEHCNIDYTFHSWVEYFQICKLEKERLAKFNPSFRREEHESKTTL